MYKLFVIMGDPCLEIMLIKLLANICYINYGLTNSHINHCFLVCVLWVCLYNHCFIVFIVNLHGLEHMQFYTSH